MNLYIRSRGFEQDDDYRWLEVSKAAQRRVEGLPTVFAQLTTNLIQTEANSVVIARAESRLLLLVTALNSGRIDFRDRQIRNSVAWVVSDTPENQKLLRFLAATVLAQPVLTMGINQAIISGGDTGFQVNWHAYEEMQTTWYKEASSLLTAELTNDARQPKIAYNSVERKQELIEELQQYSLPNRTGVLIVVTGIKKTETLIKAKVWRGLSSLVETKDWQIISEITSEVSQTNPAIEQLYRLAAIVGLTKALDLLFKLLNVQYDSKAAKKMS